MRLSTTVLVAAMLLAVGCGSGGGSDTSKSARPYAFEGKPWVLSEGIADAAQSPPTATFEDHTVTGFSGCNTYNATYTATASALNIGHIAGTLMACPPPADVVERSFSQAMNRVRKWKVSGGALSLMDGSGTQLLRFIEATVTGNWTVTSLHVPNAVSSPIQGSTITADFGEDSKLAGSGGCNDYSTTYTVEGNKITIKPVTATKKHCEEPAGVSEQETHYFAALEAARTFQLSGAQLKLLRADGGIAVSYVRR